MLWIYGVTIDEEDGDFVVRSRDLPDVLTAGDTLEEALALAADVVEVAVGVRMEREEPLPLPTPLASGERPIALPAWLAAKASVYAAWKASGLRKVELAKRLNRSEVEVRRILDPSYGTKIQQLDEAARALGGRLSVTFEAP